MFEYMWGRGDRDSFNEKMSLHINLTVNTEKSLYINLVVNAKRL